MKRKFLVLVGLVCMILPVSLFAQKDIVGVWKTIDDDGVTEKSYVEIWKDGNVYKGKIIDIFNKEDRDNLCTKCDEDDPRYNKPVLGLQIIDKLKKVDDNEWDDGEILDPNNGEVYDCKMYLDEKGNLVVRGYIGWSLIGRSQTWIKK